MLTVRRFLPFVLCRGRHRQNPGGDGIIIFIGLAPPPTTQVHWNSLRALRWRLVAPLKIFRARRDQSG